LVAGVCCLCIRLSSELKTFREYVQKLRPALTKEQLICLDSIIQKNSLNWDIYHANNPNNEQFVTKNGYKNYTISIPKEIAKQVKKKPLTYIVSIYNADEYQQIKLQFRFTIMC